MSNVWSIPSVESQPSTSLINWIVFEAERTPGVITQHLAGDLREYGEGRVSSSLVFANPETRMARTKSGRLYKLVGEPGLGSEGEYVLNVWLRINGAKLIGVVTNAVFPKSVA